MQNLQYTYDHVGNVLSIADSKVAGGTQTQSFAYDALDRLVSASAAGGSGGQGQYSETYTYNAIGNLTGKEGVTYTYPASGAGSVRPHAVRRVTGSGGTAKTVQIRAYSTPCNDGVRATMALWVNGVLAQTWTNVAATWTIYQTNVSLSGNDQIDVLFTNDCNQGGYDRNLFVDYVVVDGRTIQAEGGAAIVDKGAGAAAFDGLDVIAGQETIAWNAALRWVVGAQASAACYDANGNMTWRLRDGVAYGQTWDVDNRLASVTAHGQTTTFVYDGNGALVKQTAYENLAVGLVATSSGTLNWPGVVTNEDTWADSGDASSGEYAYTSQQGLQYVQLDLGAIYTVDKVQVWHYAGDGRTYHATKTQVSANGSTWVTVFDSAVSGEYQETPAGKTHTFTAQSVRYVRDYLNGSNVNVWNHWVEIAVWGTRTTVYAGPHYEWNVQAGVGTSYYYLGASRVAMRRGSEVYYVGGDHLGSTTLTMNSSGTKLSEVRYKAYGETRYSGLPQGTLTDYRFTGGKQKSGVGLVHLGARYYDPALSRWLSPDTLVPDPANPQSFNRYSYVYNNPLRYVDPSGYDPLDEAWEEEFKKAHNGQAPTDLDRFWRLYSIAYPGPVSGSWPWTSDDWVYASQNHNSVLADTTQHSSLADFTSAIGRISGWYVEGEEAQFVSGLALLYAGWPYDPPGKNVFAVAFPDYKPIDFCRGSPSCDLRYFADHDMAGFADRYYYNDEENTHHWVGHLLIGYHYGPDYNYVLVLIREALQRNPDRSADIDLGAIAGIHGALLASGDVTLAGFAAYLFESLRVK